jgi:hypothetical protein
LLLHDAAGICRTAQEESKSNVRQASELLLPCLPMVLCVCAFR